jgi:hypothetical protein
VASADARGGGTLWVSLAPRGWRAAALRETHGRAAPRGRANPLPLAPSRTRVSVHASALRARVAQRRAQLFEFAEEEAVEAEGAPDLREAVGAAGAVAADVQLLQAEDVYWGGGAWGARARWGRWVGSEEMRPRVAPCRQARAARLAARPARPPVSPASASLSSSMTRDSS